MNAGKMKTGKQKGFTLIELLVVMAILAILSTVGLNSFRHSQLRARDTRRKSDLEQVQRALEMYYSDYNSYPAAAGGLISTFNWGDEFKDSKGTVYMTELPTDPTNNPDYCYQSIGTEYQLYAKLENSEDPKIGGPYTCNNDGSYNYGVASPNSMP